MWRGGFRAMTKHAVIHLARQRLVVWQTNDRGEQHELSNYPISSAKLGVGELKNSFKTPRGKHEVCEKFGNGLPMYSVFRARQATGERWSSKWGEQHPQSDWILTRILWLAGCELGKNLGGEVDTQSRYIYIHGTDQEDLLGTPASHGCIRMSNHDVLQLFEQLEIGTPVDIRED